MGPDDEVYLKYLGGYGLGAYYLYRMQPAGAVKATVKAASLMVEKAAALFDAGEPCGAEANMAKMLASEASWRAGDVCMQTHGGFAFAKEYHIERKFRETRLYQIAPISTNLILSYIGEHVLGLPRSF